MAPPYLIGTFSSASQSSATLAFSPSTASNPGDGFYLTVWGNFTGSVSTASDTKGNTYNVRVMSNVTVTTVEVTSTTGIALTTGDTVTITLANTPSAADCEVTMWGVPQVRAWDTGASWAQGSSGPATNTVGLNFTTDLCIAPMIIANTQSTITPSAGYTQVGSKIAAASIAFNIWLIYKQPAGISETPQDTTTGSYSWSMVCGGFIPKGAGGWPTQRKSQYGQVH